MVNADKLFASIVSEGKLSAKDRDKLDSSQFGLPRERKYPLNDENHIRSAIMFFKHCPPNNRNELATNINKRLKELDLHIEVGRDNPFYKLSDKKYTTEAVSEGMDFNLSDNDLPIKVPTNNDELINLQNTMYDRISDMCLRRPYSENVYLRAKKINDMMTDVYMNYISFMAYNGKINTSTLYYVVIKDLCDILLDSVRCDDVYTAEKASDVLFNISNEIDCNYIHLRNSAIVCLYYTNLSQDTDKYSYVIDKLEDVCSVCDDMKSKSSIFVVSDNSLMKFITNSGIENRFGNVIDYYYQLSHKSFHSIFEIPSQSIIGTFSDEIGIGNLFKVDKLKNISEYNLSTKLSHPDIVRFNSNKSYIESINVSFSFLE